MPKAERISTTIGSGELGLEPGSIATLDAAVATFPREQLIRRVVSVLAAFRADLASGGRSVSNSLAQVLGDDGRRLSAALKDPQALFIEPLQQLVILRRALSVTGTAASSVEDLRTYFEVCRFSSDVCAVVTEHDLSADSADTPFIVAANFLLRLDLLNPPSLLNWVARIRLILVELPQQDSRGSEWANRLRERFQTVFGLAFEDIARFVGMLALWTSRFRSADEIFENPGAITFDESTFLTKTSLDPVLLSQFFERTARRADESLSDSELGGSLSILPFRDRSFLRLADGHLLPVYAPLVSEKLTYDLFWWAADPSKKQDQPWQRDWGDLIELYVVSILKWIAAETGCEFRADIKWEKGQLDAAMWYKGHVALFEISASLLTDAAAHGGDWRSLKAGLTQTLVRSERGGKLKDEAIAQVARDVKAMLAGDLREHIPIKKPTRIYPVVIAIDRHTRTPPLRLWFDEAFRSEMGDLAHHYRLGSLAVLALEDIEAVEENVRCKAPLDEPSPPGILRMLRMWQLRRDKGNANGHKAGSWYQFVRDHIGDPQKHARLDAESTKWWEEVQGLFGSRDEPPVA